MELNKNLAEYCNKYANSTVQLDLENQKIKFIDIFGNNIEQSLNQWLYIFNKSSGNVEKVKLIISENQNLKWGYTYLNIYFFKYLESGWFDPTKLKENVKNLIGNLTTKYWVNDLKIEINKTKSTEDNVDDSLKLINKYKINKIYLLKNGLDMTINLKYKKHKIPILFGEFENQFSLKGSLVCSTNNNAATSFKLQNQIFSKNYITNSYLYNLFSINHHPDCCGVKIISNHNTKFIKITDFKIFDKSLPNNIKLHFYLLKMNIFGLAPFIAHLTDRQLKSSLHIYKKLFINFRRKTLYKYINPNSDNRINVLHLETNSENEEYRHFENLFLIFLYFWFLNLKNSKNKSYYDIKLLETSKNILQNDK